MRFLCGKRGVFSKVVLRFQTLDMSSEGLGEMFQGDSVDTCAKKFLLKLMEGRAEVQVCADPGARTPIGVSGNFFNEEEKN